MDFFLYVFASSLAFLIQLPPLRWVARLGRAGGWLAWNLDRKHRRVALRNLTLCFGGEKPPEEIRAIARENLMRIGEAFACGVKTASMTGKRLEPHLRFVNMERMNRKDPAAPERNRIVAVGHFGNFEVYSRFPEVAPGFRSATTYRGLNQPGLDRLLQRLRLQSRACLFFERRKDAEALRKALDETHIVLGLLADQSAGRAGIVLPFFGRDCSTTSAPAVYALRYRCTLHTAICHRIALAQWEVVVGDEIPTRSQDDSLRSKEEIMLDVNRAFEAAIRRDPANWFWVHNRWKAAMGRAPRGNKLLQP
jgi:lauroyl/myristoyl acyltransferase